MHPIFNPETSEERKAVILDHLKGHREAIDNIQRCLASHPEIDIKTFHEKFNAFEQQHRRLIALITLNETIKKSN